MSQIATNSEWHKVDLYIGKQYFYLDYSELNKMWKFSFTNLLVLIL